jgi:rhamnulokinase
MCLLPGGLPNPLHRVAGQVTMRREQQSAENHTMTTAERTFLAADLGASSGRILGARFDGRRLELDEIHRFPNGPVATAGHLYWDVLRLWSEIQEGLRAARQTYGDSIASVGIDTWGVDFALLGRDDQLLGNPFHYRDPQTHGITEIAFQTVSRAEIFAETGLQFLEFNTLFQLLAMRQRSSPLLDAAKTLLMIPDFFHWLLTGEKASEFTDATTTQFLNPRTREWSRSLLTRFGLPTDMLQRIVAPGTVLGTLVPAVRQQTGLGAIPVVLPGTHDTASAVLAVPTTSSVSDSPDWCYISSGTWSLMGVEVLSPVIDDRCRELNFTNEGGVGGTIRLLKNISGLWLVQECRRAWARQGRDLSWDQLTSMAEQAEPLRSLIDPDDPRFVAPDDMPGEINAYCRETGQPVPDSEGAIIRCALESLALRYRAVLNWLEELTGGTIRTIHVVGGGSQNRQLCQMTASACDRPVLAGPVEATTAGNVVQQAIAQGDIGSIHEGREIIAASFTGHRYEPGSIAPWDNAYARFLELAQN